MSNELNQVVLAFSECPCFIAQDTPGPYNQRELAGIWLDWVAELSADSVRNYDLVLLCPSAAELPESVKAWGKLTRFPENNSIDSWPMGPNRVFQQVMWFYHHKKMHGPFLWIEADCVPLTPDWLDQLADDYRRGGKPFMGAVVEPDPPKHKAPRHMTGNAVYPDNAYLLAPRIMEAHHTAWDVHAAGQILRQLHVTQLIQHDWRCPEIRDADDLRRRLLPGAVVFHSDKYGAIPKILGATRRHEEPEIPILEYAARKGIPGLAPLKDFPNGLGIVASELAFPPDMPAPTGSTPAWTLDAVPIEKLLDYIKQVSAGDPLVRKRIAKFMVTNDIVNHGHCSAYNKPLGRKGAKSIQMTEIEFQKRVNAKKSDVPVSATT